MNKEILEKIKKAYLKALAIEKELQEVYSCDNMLGLEYACEKFSLAVEHLATSPKKITERIWGAYSSYLDRVLWSFDYKKYLSSSFCKDWEFLQKEYNYKIGNSLMASLESVGFYYDLPEKSLKDRILVDYQALYRIPLYIHGMRGKAVKIAKAIVRLEAELEFQEYKRKSR